MSKEIQDIAEIIDKWAKEAVIKNRLDGASVYNPYSGEELAAAIYAAGYRKDYNIGKNDFIELTKTDGEKAYVRVSYITSYEKVAAEWCGPLCAVRTIGGDYYMVTNPYEEIKAKIVGLLNDKE